MRHRRWLVLGALLGALALVAAACGNGDDEAEPGAQPAEGGCPEGDTCVELGPDDPIKIGTLLAITGPDASLGLDSQHGTELAVTEPIGRTEVLGHSIELVNEDDGCSAEGGTTGATSLAADPEIVAVIGATCSSAGEPAAQILSDAQVAIISPSNTAPSLTDPETHQEFYMRTAHNDKVQGSAMAQFASEVLGVTTAATINDGSPYADQLQQVFADTFSTEFGGEITSQDAVAVGDTDFGPLLSSIAANEPEFLFYPIFVAEGGLITAQAREVPGLSETELAGADGMLTPDWIDAAGADNAEGVVLSGPDLGFSGEFYTGEFLPAYEEKFGEPTSVFHAHAFDATNIVLDAIEEVAVEDGDNLLIPRVALKDAMFATSGFEGIVGTLDCNPTEEAIGDCNADATITVSQVQDGDFAVVWPEDKAEAEVQQ